MSVTSYRVGETDTKGGKGSEYFYRALDKGGSMTGFVLGAKREETYAEEVRVSAFKRVMPFAAGLSLKNT